MVHLLIGVSSLNDCVLDLHLDKRCTCNSLLSIWIELNIFCINKFYISNSFFLALAFLLVVSLISLRHDNSCWLCSWSSSRHDKKFVHVTALHRKVCALSFSRGGNSLINHCYQFLFSKRARGKRARGHYKQAHKLHANQICGAHWHGNSSLH